VLAEAMIGAAARSAEALREVRDLEAIAEELVARARAAWPRITLDAKVFVAHVAARIDDAIARDGDDAAPSAEDIAEALTEVHAPDLWLALACGRGHKAAIAELDRQLIPVVEGALARMRDKVSIEDVAQVLREKLLVPREGAAPKILDYSGRGPLGGWMRIAAVRTALSLTRHGDAAGMQPVTREALLDVPAVAPDPELDHLRRRYARDFKEAFEAALGELTAQERNLLRLSLVDQLSIDEIGAVFGIHRATAARRVARAREVVQERTRKIMTERLNLGSGDLRSIMLYIRSHLDLSIQRLLAEEMPEPAAGGRLGRDKPKRAAGKAKKTKRGVSGRSA
jgi:RNA polymerase sigma-70 factor, ECF subfamily